MAIEHALTILSWYENLQKDEIPPEWLWEDSEGLEMWWKSVEDKRSDGASAKGRYAADDDDDDQAPSMAENDYARSLKQ